MLSFSNFWPWFNPASIEVSYLFGPLSHRPLRVASVFGAPGYSEADVLFSGENIEVRHDGEAFVWRRQFGQTGRARFFIGTPFVDHPHALHLPFGYVWRIGNRHPRTLPKERAVCVVASNSQHGELARWRFSLAHAMSEYVPVVGSRNMQNGAPAGSRMIYRDVPAGKQAKLDFIAGYTHTLCVENSAAPGYLTEKLFDAAFAGTVGIYAGDPHVARWVHPWSFIDCTGMTAREVAGEFLDCRRLARVNEERERAWIVSEAEMAARLHSFHQLILS